MKNETEDFMALAKAYAQAERALRIERWVIVTFELRKTDGPIEILYRYDLPRTMLKRYRWVVRWRTARFQCRFPRDTITATYCYYDKRTGLKFGVDSCLSKLRAAKAQITLAKRQGGSISSSSDCAIRCFTTSRQIPNCSVSGRSYKKNCIVI